MTINVPKGSGAIHLNKVHAAFYIGADNEILLDRGGTFKISSIEEDPTESRAYPVYRMIVNYKPREQDAAHDIALDSALKQFLRARLPRLAT